MSTSYIVCAAGAGTRFKQISEKISKPFLKLNGKTFIERSLESLTFQQGDQLIILHRFSSEEATAIETNIESLFKIKPVLIKLNQLTRGQAETALYARPYLTSKQIAIFNIDTFFECKKLNSEIQSGKWDGIVPCFKAPGDCWSFFQSSQEQNNLIIQKASEKVRISDWASVGLYYFKNADLFFDLTTEALKNKNYQKELYVAPFYNDLIKLNKKCIVLESEVFKPMGTVEQVCQFWNISEKEFILQNTSSI